MWAKVTQVSDVAHGPLVVVVDNDIINSAKSLTSDLERI
jgi:hypothetical protein